MPEDSTETEEAAQAAVAEAEILLTLLSQQAAAARAEAECAELRLLLAAARGGDSQRLVHWLDLRHNNDPRTPHQAHDSLPAQLHGGKPGRSHQTLPSNFITSWEQLMPAARARLQRRLDGTAPAAPLAPAVQIGPSAKIKKSPKSESASEAEMAASEITDATAASRQPASKSSAKIPRGRPGPRPKPSRTVARLPAGVAEQPAAAPIEELSPAHSGNQRLGRRLRGIVASMVFHAVLLLGLAFFTLRLPEPPASLGLEASPTEISTETVELSQAFEVEAPPTPVEPVVPAQTADLAATLGVDSSALSDSLLDFAPPTAGLSPVAAGASLSHASAVTGMNLDATFFGAAASGNCFCYVIDSSASMRDGPWEAAKGELYRSLSSLKEKQRFYIIFFNRQLSPLPSPGERQPAPHPLYATAENLQHARRWIDTVRIDFGAPPNDALELAISKEPDAIYLLTDGDTQVDVAGFLRRQNQVEDAIFGAQVRVPIHTIAFYSLTGQALLKQIAAENKGQFIYVPDPRQR